MTKNPSHLPLAPFSRYVSKVAIVDSKKLSRKISGSHNLPKGPVLVLPVEGPLANVSTYFGITAIEGCDMLFFDVMVNGRYFCNIGSAGDRDVIQAMQHWDKAGVMPIWLETKVGPCGLIRDEFTLHEAHHTAFHASSHNGYLAQLKKRFNQLLEPGMMEGLVASRTGLRFSHVHVGFLATARTQPTLNLAH